MDKMKPTDEQRIMRSLLSVVDKTRAGADPKEVMIKTASEQGYTPQIISRMCEAYNKAKSVYMLQKTSSEQRADSFPLLNSQEIIDTVFKPMEKAASEFKPLPNLLTIDFTSRMTKRMHKVASERMAGPNPLEKEAAIDQEELKEKAENYDLVYGRLKKTEIREKAELEKQASEVRQEKIRINKTVDTLTNLLRPYSNKQLKKVAQQVYNKYDKKGDQLLSVVYAKLKKEKPTFEKTAKTVIFPLDEPFVSVVRAMDGYKHYSDLTTAQKKIEKTATLARVLAAAGIPSLNEAIIGNAQASKLEGKGGDVLLGAGLRNRLKKLDTVDAFYDMYSSDEFLKDQPVDDVLKAFNTVTSLMPSLMNDDARKAYIAPLVKKLVSEGNRVDPLELGRMASMETDMSKSDRARKESEEIDKRLSDADKGTRVNVGEQSSLEAIEKAKNPSPGILSTLGRTAEGAINKAVDISDSVAKGTGDMLKGTGNLITDIVKGKREAALHNAKLDKLKGGKKQKMIPSTPPGAPGALPPPKKNQPGLFDDTGGLPLFELQVGGNNPEPPEGGPSAPTDPGAGRIDTLTPEQDAQLAEIERQNEMTSEGGAVQGQMDRDVRDAGTFEKRDATYYKDVPSGVQYAEGESLESINERIGKGQTKAFFTHVDPESPENNRIVFAQPDNVRNSNSEKFTEAVNYKLGGEDWKTNPIVDVPGGSTPLQGDLSVEEKNKKIALAAYAMYGDPKKYGRDAVKKIISNLPRPSDEEIDQYRQDNQWGQYQPDDRGNDNAGTTNVGEAMEQVGEIQTAPEPAPEPAPAPAPEPVPTATISPETGRKSRRRKKKNEPGDRLRDQVGPLGPAKYPVLDMLDESSSPEDITAARDTIAEMMSSGKKGAEAEAQEWINRYGGSQ